MLDKRANDLQATPACYASRLWALDEVQNRLAQAAFCLRRMAFSKHSWPSEMRSAWPDVVHDWMGYGWHSVTPVRFLPAPCEISKMDETLGWLHWLTREQRIVVWGRAQHWTWAQLAELLELERHGKKRGLSRNTLRRIADDGWARILSRLNGAPPRLVVTDALLRAMR